MCVCVCVCVRARACVCQRQDGVCMDMATRTTSSLQRMTRLHATKPATTEESPVLLERHVLQ